ncbi:MAG: hypothetical protein ABIJ86_08935 [Spirochaetota bacterium]
MPLSADFKDGLEFMEGSIVFAGGDTNRGVVNGSTVYGTRSAFVFRNNIILSVSGWAVVESEDDSGNADPVELRNNAIFGGIVLHYLDSLNGPIQNQAVINDASQVLQSGGTSRAISFWIVLRPSPKPHPQARKNSGVSIGIWTHRRIWF